MSFSKNNMTLVALYYYYYNFTAKYQNIAKHYNFSNVYLNFSKISNFSVQGSCLILLGSRHNALPVVGMLSKRFFYR